MDVGVGVGGSDRSDCLWDCSVISRCCKSSIEDNEITGHVTYNKPIPSSPNTDGNFTVARPGECGDFFVSHVFSHVPCKEQFLFLAIAKPYFDPIRDITAGDNPSPIVLCAVTVILLMDSQVCHLALMPIIIRL